MVDCPDSVTPRYAPATRPRTPFRGQVYVALQSLRRRPLASLIRRLEEREQLSPEALEQLHRGELKEILEYAHACVPLYQTGPWKEALSAGASGDIGHWPLLDKETLRERVGDLRAAPAPKRPVTRYTSGSTGRRMAIVSTPEAEVWDWAHRYRGLLWHGIPIGVASLRMTHARRPLRDLVKGERSVPALDSAESVDQALRYLWDERPELVTGPPSVLFQFARHLRERNIVAALAPFARVGGEQCFDFQRREIESRLCSRAINSYGCNETGALAGECPAGSLHVYVDHVHLEIFDGGEPVPPGEIGEIVVTGLRNRAMPLVRYMVGDRARLTGEPCRCGLPHPVLTDLQARSSNMIRAADGGMRHASELVAHVGSIFSEPLADGVRQFQITQTDAGGWEVALEAPAEYPDANDQEVRRRALDDRISAIVRRFCGDDSRVAILFTTLIERENGKLNYLRTAAD